MTIARTSTGVEGAILIDVNGSVVTTGSAPAFSFPAGATAIFSLRRAVSGYAGKCLTLQNLVGGTQDIGFDGSGNLDIAAAQAFMAVNNGTSVIKWYDQSGNGRDATPIIAGTFYGSAPSSLNIVNGKPLIAWHGNYIVASGAVNGDHTVGMVLWPATGAQDQFLITHFDIPGNGWMLMMNHGGNAYKGVYYSSGSATFTPSTAKLTATSPSRLVATRASNNVTMYVNGVASGTVGSESNSAPVNHINIGGYQDIGDGYTGSFEALSGFVCEVFIYGTALTAGQLSAIDANEATYFPSIGLETPYNGQPHWAQFTDLSQVDLGNVLEYEYTQPWTVFAAIQIYDTRAYKIIFTNVTAGEPYPGYELWVDSDRGQVLHVKLIHDWGNAIYAGVYGTINVADGKKHIVAASYDGSGVVAGISLFVDGVKDTNHIESDTLGGNTIISSGQDFLVGQQLSARFGVGGAMSYFQLDKVKRSDAYIAAIKPTGTLVPPVDGNTALLLVMNEGTGTTAHDTSGNGHNGTMLDAGMWVPP